MKNLIIVVVILAALIFTIVNKEPVLGYNVGDIHPTQGWIITCQEDMSCWDCETMGNRICGR